MKIIRKLGVARFKVTTPELTGQELDLNFQPIIEHFKLTGNFLLIHWQARPKGEREWGIYSSKDDSYRSMAKLKINLATAETLQLNDKTANTIPSAVFYTGEDKLTCINDRAIIGEVFLADVK